MDNYKEWLNKLRHYIYIELANNIRKYISYMVYNKYIPMLICKRKKRLGDNGLFEHFISNEYKKINNVYKLTFEGPNGFYIHFLIIIFICIIIYTIVVSVWTFINAGADFLTNVATISVGGFWAFFLGYFGWRMGQTIEEYFRTIRQKK